MWLAPAFHQGPRPLEADRDARSGSSPRCIKREACPRSLPLAPEDAAQFAPHPAVELLEHPFGLRQPEVLQPAAQDGGQGSDGRCQRSSAPLAQRRRQLAPQPLHTLGRDPQARLFVGGHGVTEEGSHPGMVNSALRCVDREPQPKSRGFLRGLLHTTCSTSSVAVGPDSDAHAGSAEADTATFFIASALDITLTRRVSV